MLFPLQSPSGCPALSTPRASCRTPPQITIAGEKCFCVAPIALFAAWAFYQQSLLCHHNRNGCVLFASESESESESALSPGLSPGRGPRLSAGFVVRRMRMGMSVYINFHCAKREENCRACRKMR